MKAHALLALCSAGLLSLGVVAGCESDVATDREVSETNDKVVTEETKVTETPDGDLKKTESRTVEEK